MKYRGYEIEQSNPYTSEWYAIDPDADYDWEGEETGYRQCSGMPQHCMPTLEDVKAEIDNYYEELDEDHSSKTG